MWSGSIQNSTCGSEIQLCYFDCRSNGKDEGSRLPFPFSGNQALNGAQEFITHKQPWVRCCQIPPNFKYAIQRLCDRCDRKGTLSEFIYFWVSVTHVSMVAAFGHIADDYYIPGRRDLLIAEISICRRPKGYSLPVVHRTPADNITHRANTIFPFIHSYIIHSRVQGFKLTIFTKRKFDQT